jgi:2-polyprenyl-3-methyl-5-hydroxy-6-metoxy-1,4-benzoquinol methylase
VSSYLFEHGWDQERRRLDLLEQTFDPATIDHLGRVPLPFGGHCLEIGAGAGSIARWLCDRVGPDGRVVATDLDTGFLEHLTEKNLEVRRHDIAADELEEGAFDLIHSRLVLEHIPERTDVVKRLAAALRPGGWLVLEDFDWCSLVASPTCTGSELLARSVEAMRIVFPAAGATTDYGRCLPLDLRAAGLVDVGAEGRAQVALSGTPAGAWWQLTLAKLGRALLGTGLLSAAELDEILRICDDEGFCLLFPTMVTTWGRRPG